LDGEDGGEDDLEDAAGWLLGGGGALTGAE
jgi:hypothetical protein